MAQPKSVLMALDDVFPPDIRVEKEAAELHRRGYTVHLLCRPGANAAGSSVGGIVIHTVADMAGRAAVWRKAVLVRYGLTFRHPVWISAMCDLVWTLRIDVLHVHDLPLVASAVAVKARTGVPVIADLHENYGEALRAWSGEHRRAGREAIVQWLLNDPDRWARHELKILHEVDRILVVVDEARMRLTSAGVPAGRISVVSNTESRELWDGARIDPEIAQRYRDAFVVSYLGGVGPHRGLDCAIRAMPHLVHAAPDLRLVIVGRQTWYWDWLQRLVKEVGVGEAVNLIPWVPREKVPSYMKLSRIGLVPHNSNPHTEATVPHKLFQYMLFGCPVVVSSCRPLRRIVEETESGLVFSTGDASDLAEKILRLYRSAELRQRLGINGQRAASAGRYNWSHDAAELGRVYESLP